MQSRAAYLVDSLTDKLLYQVNAGMQWLPRLSRHKTLDMGFAVTFLYRHAVDESEERLGHVGMRLLGLEFM